MRAPPEAMARLAAEDAARTENAVEVYNRRYPDRPLGPFPDLGKAEAACGAALAAGRELTQAERRRVEYQAGDDLTGSRF